MGMIEDELKSLIIDKYKSIRAFTVSVDMPYSTVDSIFKRGIKKASVDNIIKICNELEISADALVEGSITYKNEPTTIAAHFDGDEYTEEELDEIKNFAEYVKNKRK